jgi:two-component system nitrate/nitrite response regulator NarL
LVGVEKYSSATSDLLRRVLTTNPGVKAVILAAHHRPNDVVAALQAGAHGFLCQDIPGERLTKSLELIARDEMVVLPRLASEEWKEDSAPEARRGDLQTLPHSDSQSPAAREPEGHAGYVTRSLTRREMLILRSLMEGASNKVIALKLVMTESTVKVHVKTILRKLRLENRTQAAMWARDHAREFACDRGPLGRTGFGPTIETHARAAANMDPGHAPAEL